MVVFGGLELVAAGYLLHQHAKNKEEQRRLEEEEEELRRRRRRERHRRNRSYSRERRHYSSDDRKYSSAYEDEDDKPSRQSRPQYLAPQTTAMKPARANSAPPPAEYYPPQPVGQRQNGIYPPTGWPSDWEQSRRPEAGANGYPADVKYGWRDDQPHQDPQLYSPAPASAPVSHRRDHRSQGRSDSRYTASSAAAAPAQMSGGLRPVTADSDSAYGSNPPSANVVQSPHVRFALPRDGERDPPPAYRA